MSGFTLLGSEWSKDEELLLKVLLGHNKLGYIDLLKKSDPSSVVYQQPMFTSNEFLFWLLRKTLSIFENCGQYDAMATLLEYIFITK